METSIEQLVASIEPELVSLRRDFHKYAEVGWTEFRTTAILAEKVIKREAMMGVPKADILQKHMERAVAQGATLS